MRRFLWIFFVLAGVVAVGCASEPSTGPKVAQPGPETSGGAAPQPGSAPAAALPQFCAALDESVCRADERCQVVRGARVSPAAGAEPAAYCLGPRAALGCIPSQLCGEALTYFCNEAGEVFEVSNTCGPTGWRECPAPEPLSGPCSP
jgi:hypothetical protein